MTENLNTLDSMLDEDRFRLWTYLRKTSQEVLFAEDTTRQAGEKLVLALDALESMVSTKSWLYRCQDYDVVRQNVTEALAILNLPEDNVFAENTIFLPTIVKNLRYLASFIQQSVQGDQGFAALNALLSDKTSALARQLGNEYRRLLFMQLKI